jgi:hypothetical protein
MHRSLAWTAVIGSLALATLLCAPAARAASTPTSVTLAWTSPGDDGLTGTASVYDVRYSTSAITAANFASATAATGAPAPLVAGSAQSMQIGGLTPATQYWFAIKTADESGNWSGVSNIVIAVTPASSDSVRPAALAVNVTATGASSVTLGWTATGDDSLTGTAAAYEVRWSASPITAGNFASATLVTTGVPLPAAPGTAQSVLITGLDRSVDLWFAARVRDEVNQWSALSNVPRVPHVLDTSPPATPSGLTASLQGGGIHLHWNANAEPDLAGYHVFRAPSATGPFALADTALLASPDYVDANAPDSASLWYQVSAIDRALNESGRTTPYRVWLRGASFSAVRMLPAYPNPSGAGDVVVVPIEVPAGASLDGRLELLNSAGERVRTLVLTQLPPGISSVSWDGHSESGRVVAPGVYRAVLTLGGSTEILKLVRKP